MWRDTGLRYIPFGVAKIVKQNAFPNTILKFFNIFLLPASAVFELV
jgi:hypothetical protein